MRSQRSAVAPDAPGAWQKARVDAAAELAAIEARIPSVIIALSGAPVDGATMTIDGAPVAASALGTPIRLEPGAHTFAAEARGRAPITSTIQLDEGPTPRRIDLVIHAETPPPAASTPPGVRVDPRVTPATLLPPRGPLLPGIVALGVGAAGLVLGGITGARASSLAAEGKANCNAEGRCLRTDEVKEDCLKAAANGP